MKLFNVRHQCLVAGFTTLFLSACGGQAIDVTTSSSASSVVATVSSIAAVSSIASSSLAASSVSSAAMSSSSSLRASSSSLPISSSAMSSSSSAAPAVITTLIEEGDQRFCPFSGAVEAEHTGFTGAGYANGVNAVGASLTWAIKVDKPGNYTLNITYANGAAANRPATFSVNANTQQLAFATTELWTNWQPEKLTVALSAGSNTLVLTATTAVGLPNIDSLSVAGAANVWPASCPESAPITIWLAGDSTVANGQTPCPVGWGKVLAEYFNNKVTVQNYAVGGRSVRTWLYDVTSTMGGDGECTLNNDNTGKPIIQSRWTSMQDQMRPGDYLFIQFGINDGDKACPRHVGGTALKNEYRMMANAAKARGAFPVLLTPAPAIKCSGSTAVNSRGFLTEVFAVANELNIPVIDLHKIGTDLYNQLAFCPVAGGDVSASTGGAVGEFFCDDHTHFDTPGARKIAEVITKELAAQASPLANYLKK